MRYLVPAAFYPPPVTVVPCSCSIRTLLSSMSLSYRSDPAWADVTPLPQDDGADPVVPIAYSAACTTYIPHTGRGVYAVLSCERP